MNTTKSFNGQTISNPSQPIANGTTTNNLLPHAPQYTLRRSLPNTPLAVSFISACLGGLVVSSLICALQPVFQLLGSSSWSWARSRLGIYGLAMGTFHLLEFWTTAGWNPQKLSVDGELRDALYTASADEILAFLLNNTTQYNIAHAAGLAEYFISSYFFPKKFSSWYGSTPVLMAGEIPISYPDTS
jgi:protein-S-isoprenylcysteine O-methyltransferase